jgi:hypothetical protein
MTGTPLSFPLRFLRCEVTLPRRSAPNVTYGIATDLYGEKS